MIRLLSFAIALSSQLGHGGEKPDEIDSYESAFHHTLHDGAGFCLVCYTEVVKQPWREEWEQLRIRATIVEVFSGDRKIGDKIEFRRVLDGKFGDISHLQGALKFVRFDRKEDSSDSETFVDVQDPQAIFGYSPEFHRVAREHRRVQQTEALKP